MNPHPALHRCKDHPDYHLSDKGWCWFADHYSTPYQEVPVELVKEQPSSKELAPGHVSLTAGDGTILFEGTQKAFLNATEQTARKLADKLTGELPPLGLVQPTLDPTIFPATRREEVPMMVVTFAGKVEMTQAEFTACCDQEVERGRRVRLTASGYLPMPAAAWVKRTWVREDGEKDTAFEPEGRIQVKIDEIGSFVLGGFYDGK